MGAPRELIAGRYRLERRIAAGGMGVVWEARDELLQRPVAVKQLRLQAGFTEDEAELAKQRAMREARITARLHHPHAVPVFDSVEHEGEPCLVMQYVPSEPLSTLIRRRAPLPVGEVARLGAEVASALAAAHSLGIVHRDVKPGNILIADADGAAMLSDFGISHASGDATLTSTGFVHGTPAYLAPEVARGEDSTPASDVFSLGSTLYAASEGRPPFGEEPNSIAVLHRVASGGFQAPKDSGALTPLLLRMMASEPSDRPTMAEVARRLAEVQADADDVPVPTLPLVSDAVLDDPDQPTAWVPVQEEHTATLVAEAVPAASAAAAASASASATATAASSAPVPSATAAPTRTAPTVEAPEEVPDGPPTAEVAPPLVPPPAAASHPDEPPRRRRRGLAVLIAVAVVLVAVGAFGLVRALLPGDSKPAQRTTSVAAAPRSSAASPSAPATTTAASPSVTPTTAPTSTATRTPSQTPGASAAGGTATPVAAIEHYYSLVPGDTDDAWQLLTGSYRENHAGGRSGFDEFWRPVRSVTATDVRQIGTDAVEATLTYRRSDGSVTVEDTTFQLVDEGGELRISDSSVVSSR